MRFGNNTKSVYLLVLSFHLFIRNTESFTVSTEFARSYKNSWNSFLSLTEEDQDCECVPTTTIYTGKLSTQARDIKDYWSVCSTLPLFTVDGVTTNLKEILFGGDSTSDLHLKKKISIVVFLRSLG